MFVVKVFSLSPFWNQNICCYGHILSLENICVFHFPTHYPRCVRVCVSQVMAARRSLVLETCMEYVGHGVQRPSNPYFATKFFPSSLTLGEEEGLAWCRVGKVATTAWSAFFLLLREVPLHQIKVNVVLYQERQSLNIQNIKRFLLLLKICKYLLFTLKNNRQKMFILKIKNLFWAQKLAKLTDAKDFLGSLHFSFKQIKEYIPTWGAGLKNVFKQSKISAAPAPR